MHSPVTNPIMTVEATPGRPITLYQQLAERAGIDWNAWCDEHQVAPYETRVRRGGRAGSSTFERLRAELGDDEAAIVSIPSIAGAVTWAAISEDAMTATLVRA